jgi:drug/metabolite transporter (DMT)-like permease
MDLRRGTFPSVALAFAGTLIIAKGRLDGLSGLHFSLGNLWSLLTAMSFAWFSLKARDFSRTIPALPLTVVTGWSGLLLVMLPVYIGWLVLGGEWFAFEGASLNVALASIAFIGLLPTMLGNLFYLYGVSMLGPARAAAFVYLSPRYSQALHCSVDRRRKRSELPDYSSGSVVNSSG